MLKISNSYNDWPWCIIGEFNVITSTDKKQGGIPYYIKGSLELIGVIKGCGLTGIGFTGQKFTGA